MDGLCAGSAEVAEWTLIGEWHVGGWPPIRGLCGLLFDRGLDSTVLERGLGGIGKPLVSNCNGTELLLVLCSVIDLLGVGGLVLPPTGECKLRPLVGVAVALEMPVSWPGVTRPEDWGPTSDW